MILNYLIPEKTEDLLCACVSKRLSPAILDKTIKNSNSQKVESFNRVLRGSLPRNVTFTCIFSGQAHSAAHSSNHWSATLSKVCVQGSVLPFPPAARSTGLSTSFRTPMKWIENISNHNPIRKNEWLSERNCILYKIHQLGDQEFKKFNIRKMYHWKNAESEAKRPNITK